MNANTQILVDAVKKYAQFRGQTASHDWSEVSRMTDETIAKVITGSSSEMGAKRAMSRFIAMKETPAS